MDLTLFKEFGLIGIVFGAIFALLFIIIKWTLSTTKDILNQAAEERKSWIKAIEERNTALKAFNDSVTEAHKYQREEHKQMIEVLGRINGYKK